MFGSNVSSTVRRSPRDDLPWLAVAILVEVLLVTGYFLSTPAEVLAPRYVVYPLVWINVGLWAVVRTPLPRASGRAKLLTVAIAVAYFLLLAWLSGLVGLHTHEYLPRGLWLAGLGSIGWGPRIAFVTDLFYLYFIPYKVIGYLSLAYLVYATLLEAADAAISGALGVFACVSCTFPVFSSLAAGILGPSAVVAAIYEVSVDISTLVFVLAVALLYWGPSLGRSLWPASPGS
ncbi:MAG: hypothetical protein ABEJ57_06410 [Halobacteriaceae archaeon]